MLTPKGRDAGQYADHTLDLSSINNWSANFDNFEKRMIKVQALHILVEKYK